MFSLQHPSDPLQTFLQLLVFQPPCREVVEAPPKPFLCLFRVKAAQNELGQQILADFEEAFPSQGTKVKFSLSLFLPLKTVTEKGSLWLLLDLALFYL